jgi:hypothetical protein
VSASLQYRSGVFRSFLLSFLSGVSLTFQRILRYFNHAPERALVHWKEWVKWRHDVKVDEITDQDIAFEVCSYVAATKSI